MSSELVSPDDSQQKVVRCTGKAFGLQRPPALLRNISLHQLATDFSLGFQNTKLIELLQGFDKHLKLCVNTTHAIEP